MVKHTGAVKTYEYTAYTLQQGGLTFKHQGTQHEAINLAKQYAKEAFPSHAKGYGPHILLRDVETGERIHCGRI